MKFGNVYVNQADISFASKVDVIVTFRGPALPPEEPPLGKLGMGLGLAFSLFAASAGAGSSHDIVTKIVNGEPIDDEPTNEPALQVTRLSVPALKIDFKNGKTKTIVPFPVKYNNGYIHTFDTTNNKPIKEYAQNYVKKYRNQVDSWLSQLE